MRKILAICLLVAVLLAGCTDNTPQARDTLVVGTSQMEGKFSPFFYTNAYDFRNKKGVWENNKK